MGYKERRNKLPEGWEKCAGMYYESTIERWLTLWNSRNDGYYYKAFPRHIGMGKAFVIARRRKEEIENDKK